MDKKYWHAFYVSNYKGGELHVLVNTNVKYILKFIVSDEVITERLDEIPNLNILTDEDLYEIYCSAISDDLYAYENRSAPEIYTTSEDGKLKLDFPPKEEIVNYMYEILNWYKETYGKE